MRIRFISDIHSELNTSLKPTDFIDIMHKKEPADVTLIAGDMDADITEAKNFLDKYFKDEKVIFIGGNHIFYNARCTPLEDLLKQYQETFKDQHKFINNSYVWLSDNIAVIGTIGWTDFLYDYKTKSQYVKEINREKAYRAKHKDTQDLFDSSKRVPIIYSDYLPEDPAKEYDESRMGDKTSYRYRRMRDAWSSMNDYNYGYISWTKKLTPQDTYEQHRLALKSIRRCYKEIVSKNPDATIILMTHHPFTSKCVSPKYYRSSLNAAFISNHDRWLKQFSNIKYIHCGHVHQRFVTKLGDKQVICNPMGYLYNYEHIQDKPFDINYMIEV